MAFIPQSGSVVTFQSDPTKLVGTVSIIGSPTQIAGSILAVNMPSPSVIAYQAAGSVLAVSGTFSSTPQSSITALQLAGSVLAVNMPSSSVVAYQLAGSIMAVSGSFSSTPQSSIIATQIAGSVLAVGGTVLLSNPNSSVQLLAGINTIGSVAVLQGTSPWVVNMPSPSIVIITPAGSIQAVRTDNASVIAVLSNSSVTALQGTNPWTVSQNNGSITGSYPDNSAWTEGLIGVYGLNVRNDTMSSVSAADMQFSPGIVGPIGETIIANAPITKWVRGATSVFTGASVQAIAPQGVSIFTYITSGQVTNASANNVFLTFTTGLGGISSVIGYSPAPANGGAILNIPNAWLGGANSGISVSVSGVASIYLALQGFISKT